MKKLIKHNSIKKILILIFLSVLVGSCDDVSGSSPDNINYRKEMRNFVINISTYAKSFNSDFIIIPQNGQQLITDSGEIDGTIEASYVNALDATGIEDMFYGYNNDDEATPQAVSEELVNFCLLWEQNGLEVLATDYCFTHSKMDNSYNTNEQYDFISFAADERELNNIPDYPLTPYNVNTDNITKISDAKNFLYIINSENFSTKQEFITAISNTNYDVILIDLFHLEEEFTESEIAQLKIKNNGSTRMVVCYMSIGEAEDYRYYWQSGWTTGNPGWLMEENPNWEGNYKVKFWDTAWQYIIYGNTDSYLYKILDAGFDGVYLDIIDGYEYFE